MRESLLSLLTGGVVGLVFGLLRLPIPAPTVLAGILGVAGIWLGFVLAQRLLSWFG